MYVENTEFVLKFKQIFWKKKENISHMRWICLHFQGKFHEFAVNYVKFTIFFFCVLEGIIM